MKVFLTGASGFVGRSIARRLIADGHMVTAAVRPTSDTSMIPCECRLELVDLLSEPDTARCLTGVEVIFHNAGAVKARSGEDFDMMNAGTTAVLVNAARKCCPEALFILTSSQAAAGPCGAGPLTPYGRSKVLAEQAATGMHRYIIVRPPAVFGPGDRATEPLYKWARRGITVSFGNRKGGFCMISDSDLADFMVQMIDCPEAEGSILQPSYPETVTWKRFHNALEKAVGRKIFMIPVPSFMVYAAGFFTEFLANLTGSCPMVTREKARELTASSWLNLQHHVKKTTGWSPNCTPEETLCKAASSITANSCGI